MIFTYYNFELLPIGANIKINCVSSNISVGIGESYFISSIQYYHSMTFEYINNNGIVIGIETNLTVTNATWNGALGGTYSFTLTENEITKNNGVYIKLLCNKVKIPTFIYNYGNNGFSYANFNGNDRVTIGSYSAGNSCNLASYLTVSWNLNETQTLYYGENSNTYRYYRFYGFWEYYNGSKNGENIGQFVNHSRQIPNITIPRLDGNNSGFTDLGAEDEYGNYWEPYFWTTPGITKFTIGYGIWYFGESGWVSNSRSKIIGNNVKKYNSEGYYNFVNIDTEINNNNGLPTLYELSNWKGKQFYYGGGGYYSPSEVTLQTIWY